MHQLSTELPATCKMVDRTLSRGSEGLCDVPILCSRLNDPPKHPRSLFPSRPIAHDSAGYAIDARRLSTC